MDLFGPAKVPALDGSRFGCVTVDRSSHLVDVDGLQRKSDALDALKRYRHTYPGDLKEIHSDGGGEWLGKFSQYCRENNIRQTFTCPYSEFENGQAEHMVGVIKRRARRNLLDSGLPDQFWLRAAHTAGIQHNQSVSKRSGNIPHDVHWRGTRANMI